jgi:hypothetical protein
VRYTVLIIIATVYLNMRCSPAPQLRDCVSKQTEAEWIINSSLPDSVKIDRLEKLFKEGY